MTTQEAFIQEIAPLIQKYAPQYGIAVCSPIIAQACLESGYGTSSLVDVYNYFGLKWRNNRCAVSNEYVEKQTNEQKSDGTYYTIIAKFMKFHSMEEGVEGYFQWTNISNYSNLKGVTDPQTYLENIKADKYATSIDYVQNNMNVIKKWNLTQYDSVPTTQEVKSGMTFNVHAGHNPDGKVACGAIGLIKESTEARAMKDSVIQILKDNGHSVYDCTVDDGTSQNDVLKKIVKKCNAHTVDMDISIHFNSGRNDYVGDGSIGGTEVWLYDNTLREQATKICQWMESLGFKNRGVKNSQSLYVLKNTKAPAMLIEVCFVDDADDVALYQKQKDAIPHSIAAGLLGYAPTSTTVTTEVPSTSTVTKSTETTTAQVTTSSYVVSITCGVLNVRKDGNSSAQIVTTVRKNEKYTIVEEKAGWGKLKSGAGWINLSYTKKV